MVDQDADGKLDYPEFEKLYGVMKTQGSLADDREDELVTKTRNMRRTMKYMLWAITGLVLFLSASVAANFGVIFAVVDGAKDTQVGGSTNNMQDRAGNLVAVAEAQVAVPLYALPALENDAVHQIKSMQVTYHDAALDSKVQAHLMVARANHFSPTHIELCSTSACTEPVLRVRDGEAHLLDNGIERVVCAAEASCSSVQLDESELDGLLERADAALEAAGVSPVDSRARQLHQR